MHINRTLIREVMQKLAVEGFVKMIPNQIMIVTEISLKDFKEVLQIRGILEGLAIRIAAKKIDEEEISELKKIITQNDL